MAKPFKSWDVEQLVLLPSSVPELGPAGHLAHFVRNTGRDSLDLLASLKPSTEAHGFPPYDPVMMTALLRVAHGQGLYAAWLSPRSVRSGWISWPRSALFSRRLMCGRKRKPLGEPSGMKLSERCFRG
jgi:hypothetical protein